MKLLASTLLLLVLMPLSVQAVPLPQQPDKRLQDLQRVREKLKRETDPINRAKSDIKISEILLSLTGDAVRNGDMKTMEQRLGDYVSTIQDAHDTLMKTHRDAHKKPKGFKDLEISLRRQINQLKDMGDVLTFDQRQPIEKARDEASHIREDLLKALFGSQNGTTDNS